MKLGPTAPPPALMIMGPTGSGKSALAFELAQRIDVEIVSVDSAQVYRGMDIGTAKPARDELARVPHHLVDIVDPTEPYSAARFVRDARPAMDEVSARGRLPLLVGGTMLYFKALREGLSTLPGADAQVRARIEHRAAERGWPALHAELARIDPETARRLEPGDAQRIQRALEIHEITGEPMSALVRHGRDVPHSHRLLGIALEPSERTVLHQRIARRFDDMLGRGLVQEVVALRAAHALDPALPSMRSVGYRQVWQYLDGAFDLAALREKGIAATRQLAKRQLTWLRGMQNVERFDCLAPDLAEQVFEAVQTRLTGTE
ncbi:MAG: tRNA (adenosine(37)-N6)-dimethylallyltransferase MiaA [Burkholderiales bacterium]|nr:tRNA (adenosine(37)-N6)-dimethylallyltransferase MiaA [Burkholderiales bacterium]